MKKSVIFTLEREQDMFCVFADVPGFYLMASDIEIIANNLVVLAQHCFWRNTKTPAEVVSAPDVAELLQKGTVKAVFEDVDVMRAPSLSATGEWWHTPGGLSFFVPEVRGKVSAKIMDRIRIDFKLKGQ